VNPANPIGTHKLLFLMACVAAWFGIINSVREIVKEAPLYQRERMVGIGIGPYVASKVVVLALLSTAQMVLFIGVIALRFEFPSQGVTAPAVVEILTTLLVTALTGLSFGLALSASTTSANRAMSLTPLLLFPQIIFAGVVFQLDGVADVISWLTAPRPALQALAAAAMLPIDPHGEVLDATKQTAAYLLGRWAILAGLSALGVACTVVTLRRRGRIVAPGGFWTRVFGR
jgi:hypothetical protein